MKKRMIMFVVAALALLSASGQVEFHGTDYSPIEVKPSKSATGLDMVFVIYDTQGVSMSYTATTGEPVVWSFYDEDTPALNPQEIAVTHSGSVTTLEQDQFKGNRGYIIKEGSSRVYSCWVVNYADYYMELNSLSFDKERPCELVSFDIDGHCDPIPYYANNVSGTRQVLDREVELKYSTLSWNDSIWEPNDTVEVFPALDQAFQIVPPLCNTAFRLTGDRFLKEWGVKEVSIESRELYETQAVSCGTVARLEDDGEYTKVDYSGITDGSAPLHIIFTGNPTDAVVYRKWEIATDESFENVIMQYNLDELDYTFSDVGTFYVRYMVANSDGSCDHYSDTYTIDVGISELGEGERGDLPNVFSPGSTPGVNDVWTVHTKSIVEFHCWIFNRWGNLVYEFTDPDGGWDGYHNGKLVDTGVYYYVITALGSDGKSYKKRGSITVMRYKRSGEETTTETGN